MATVDNVIERQHQLFGVISRTVDNMKKLGPSRTNRGTILSRIEALKTNWEKFQTNHEHLFRACSSEQKKHQYFTDDLYALCEEEFIEANGTMINLLENLERSENNINQTSDVSVGPSIAMHSRRLPRIDLPKFSGDYTQWSHFRNLFVSMIVENAEISSVEKLHYLKMSLSGEPAQHLKNIAISSENFVVAWDALVARYENKRILIDAQVALLFSSRKVKSENATDLMQLLGSVKEALGALEALECPVRHWDLLVIFLMTQRLDSDSLRRWEEKLGAQANPPSFSEFETFLVGRIYTLEALERSQSRKSTPSSTVHRTTASARSYVAAASEQQCALCDLNHYLSSCPKYLDQSVDQRREIIKSKSLCYNCLGPHLLKVCRNQKRCRTCRKQHHTTLHSGSNAQPRSMPTTSEPTASNFVTRSSNAAIAVHDVATKGTERSSHSAQSGVVRRIPSVLLATATVNVRSRFGEHSQVRALLDQGSEVSFISENLSQTLRLPRRAAAIPILGIGAQRTLSQTVSSH